MKSVLRLLVLPLAVLLLLTVSACDNSAENSKNTILNTGVKIGHTALQGSIAECTKAINLDPKSAKAFAGRGAIKYAMGDSKGAILDFTKAIELNSKSVAAYSGRGSAKFAVGDIPGATDDFITVARLVVFSVIAPESGSDSGKDSGTGSDN